MQELPGVSATVLRDALRSSGYPLSPLVEGVRQDSLDELERTLLALLGEYESSDHDRKRAVREIVITARQHCQWTVAKHPEKTEALLWLRTWLENPPLFPEWAALRRRML
jgi:hypothetical protein